MQFDTQWLSSVNLNDLLHSISVEAVDIVFHQQVARNTIVAASTVPQESIRKSCPILKSIAKCMYLDGTLGLLGSVPEREE